MNKPSRFYIRWLNNKKEEHNILMKKQNIVLFFCLFTHFL